MNFSHPSYQRLNPGQEVSTTGEILSYAAETYPDKIGLICGERCFTFAELDKAANRFAHYIHEELRDRDGPVAIMGKNSAEYAVTHFGIARSGRYSVNLHTRTTVDDLVYTINLTKPALIVADSGCRDLIDAAQGKFATPPRRIEIPEDIADTSSSFWQSFANQSGIPPEIKIDPDDAAPSFLRAVQPASQKPYWPPTGRERSQRWLPSKTSGSHQMRLAGFRCRLPMPPAFSHGSNPPSSQVAQASSFPNGMPSFL